MKKLYKDKGITYCEVGRVIGNVKCAINNMLSFAHKQKRINYRSNPEKLSSYEETVVCCVPCHMIIEQSKELTQKVFSILRPL